MTLLGVDAGQKGGICVLRDGEVDQLWEMPLLDDRTLDSVSFFNQVSEHHPDKMIIEQCFKPISLLWMCGEITSLCKLIDCGIHIVSPNRWKKAILGQVTSDKAISITRCQELYPDVNLIPPRCRVPKDGLAEAVLVARYLYDQEKGCPTTP